MRKNIIIFSLFIIIASGLFWAGCTLPRTFHALKNTQSNIAAEQSRTQVLETALASIENKLKATETALSGKTTELEESRGTLASATDYLTLIQSQLEYSQNQLNQVQKQLAIAQEQLTSALNDVDESSPPRPFNSIQEAQAWLDNNHLPVVLIADPSGAINFSQPQADARYDCDDYARDYQQLALKSGYIINLCPVIYGRVWGIAVSDVMEAHIGCWAQIDDIYYYIESVPCLNNSYQLTRITSAD